MRTIPGHLVSMEAWNDWVDYENYFLEDANEKDYYDAYRDTPGKKECDELCARLSGEVIVYYLQKPRA